MQFDSVCTIQEFLLLQLSVSCATVCKHMMCLLSAADLKLQVDNLRQSEEKLLAEARHRDSVLEDKIRNLRLVSQERDRLQASNRGSKLESKISGPQAAQVRVWELIFGKIIW